MIAQYGIENVTKMLAPEELKLVVISSGKEKSRYPEEYLLYGEEIRRYSVALTALRDICDEITRRGRSGIVMPRIIVSIDDPYALIMRCRDDEVRRLLRVIYARGLNCGIEPCA